MRGLNVTHREMAEKTNRNKQTEISVLLARTNLTIETIIPMLEVLDCDLIVRKRGTEIEIPVTLDDTSEKHIFVIG